MKDNEPINRVTHNTDETRINYDRLSRWYDLLAGIAEKKYKMAGLDLLQVEPGECVLEIGFGTGQCLIPLAKAVGERGFVDGIDLSEGMQQVAQKKLIQAGYQELVQLQVGDARDLPYMDDRFDAVYISFTLELFSALDMSLVLQQVRRVLKPEGRLCVVAMAKKPQTNLITRCYEWLHSHYPRAIDCRPIYVVSVLVENGFNIDQVQELSLFGLPVDVVLGSL